MHSIDVLAPITEQEKKASVEIDVAELASEIATKITEAVTAGIKQVEVKDAEAGTGTTNKEGGADNGDSGTDLQHS